MIVTWAEACAPLLKVGWAFENLAVSIRLVFLCLLGIALPLTVVGNGFKINMWNDRCSMTLSFQSLTSRLIVGFDSLIDNKNA
ncbi:hypothetical protein AB3S75_047318 [Citrus x aurantiifolia]